MSYFLINIHRRVLRILTPFETPPFFYLTPPGATHTISLAYHRPNYTFSSTKEHARNVRLVLLHISCILTLQIYKRQDGIPSEIALYSLFCYYSSPPPFLFPPPRAEDPSSREFHAPPFPPPPRPRISIPLCLLTASRARDSCPFWVWRAEWTG